MKSAHSITLELGLPEADKRALLDRLVAFGDCFVPPRHYTPVAAVLRDSTGALCGGLLGATLWEWLQVDALWVHDSLRRRGYGSQLLRLAEAHAASVGCHFARLDTFDFEARTFYERHGYRVYAELPDFPRGHTQFHLRKSLVG
jgi:GNAT superfamily N-acetyltransferase